MAERMPVTGPFRVYVDAAPNGVDLDVSHMIAALLLQLAQDFEEDPEGVGHDLVGIAELNRAAKGPDSHAVHERDERVDRLLESIGGGAVPVYGRQVLLLAEQLRILGSRALPRPSAGGGATG